MAEYKKKASDIAATVVFGDESGFSLIPAVQNTWAPKGQTPIIRHSYRRERLNVVSGITTTGQLMFMVEKEPIGAKLFAKFIRHLLRHIDGNIILIWDNLPAHKSAAVLKEVEASKGRISIEYLPPYAPELNPQEGIWSYLKRHQLANFCLQNLQELKRELRLAVVRTRVNVQLILNIIQGTSLSMEGLLR